VHAEDDGGAAEEFFESLDFGSEGCGGEEGLETFGKGFGHAEEV